MPKKKDSFTTIIINKQEFKNEDKLVWMQI